VTQDPGISVVIPVRNGVAFLPEAVASARDQDLAPLEIIVVDDGSQDGSAEIAGLAGAVVLRQQNRGAGAARNEGARRARGSMVAFLDADDRMLPGRLRLQSARLAEDPELDGVLGLIRTFDEEPVDRGPESGDEPETVTRYGPPEPGWLPSTLLVRRSSFLDSGGFDEELMAGEFVDWISRCRQQGRRFALVDHLVAERRAHAGNTTRDRARLRQGYLDVARLAVARHRERGDLP
jgi:glycosyltransferase involved in cell wall biosynthesis